MKHKLAGALSAIALTLSLAACGSTPRLTVKAPVKAPAAAVKANQSCSGSNYHMQCALEGLPAPESTVLAPESTVLRPGGAFVVHGADFTDGGSAPSAATLKANGFQFAMSYIGCCEKQFESSTVHAYLAAGIKVGFVLETYATEATNGYGAGQADARYALSYVRSVGLTPRVIYYAVDFPGSAAQVSSYFSGVDSVTPGGAKNVGVYGSYAVTSGIRNMGRAGYEWQTYAWSGASLDSRAQLYQDPNGNAWDYDRAFYADWGQYPAPVTPPKPPTCEQKYQARLAAERKALAGAQMLLYGLSREQANLRANLTALRSVHIPASLKTLAAEQTKEERSDSGNLAGAQALAAKTVKQRDLLKREIAAKDPCQR